MSEEAQEFDPVNVAQRLAGRELTSEEIADYFRIKEELGIPDNDAFWTVLLALGYYKTAYEAMPERIRQAGVEIMAEYKVSLTATAEAAERAMINRIERDSAEAVKRMLDQAKDGAAAVSKITGSQRLRLLAAIAGLVAFCAAGLLLWGGFQLGKMDNAAELAWLHTKEGQAAKRFAELNNVERYLACEEPLSVVERKDGTFCSPYDASKGTTRTWRIK